MGSSPKSGKGGEFDDDHDDGDADADADDDADVDTDGDVQVDAEAVDITASVRDLPTVSVIAIITVVKS